MRSPKNVRSYAFVKYKGRTGVALAMDQLSAPEGWPTP